MRTDQIHIRDPYVVPDQSEEMYYLFGTTDDNHLAEKATGFDCYRSKDLEEWEGPIVAFRPPEKFWADRNFWAPKVYPFNNAYYMVATFKANHRFRGTQILKADALHGMYRPITGWPITPINWESRGGTFYIDPQGAPWLIFAHDWTQVHDGEIHALPLNHDLTSAIGRSHLLFCASEVPWVRGGSWKDGNERWFPDYIADAPFVYRANNGELLMLWSSDSDSGRTIGVARSESGLITGPWRHDDQPFLDGAGGNVMIFETFDNRLMMAFHTPYTHPDERAAFVELVDKDGELSLK